MNNHIISVPKTFADDKLLVDGEIYHIQFGLSSTRAVLKVRQENNIKESTEEIWVSPEILLKLNLPQSIKYNMMVDQYTRSIIFGPVIGILVNPHIIKTIKEGKLPENFQNYIKLSRDKSVLFYFFSYLDIDWTEKNVWGWSPGIMGQWIHKKVTLPEIIYDNENNFTECEKIIVDETRLQCKKNKIILINSKISESKLEQMHELATIFESARSLSGFSTPSKSKKSRIELMVVEQPRYEICHVSPRLANILKFNHLDNYLLKVGSSNITVKVVIDTNINGMSLGLKENILEKLGLNPERITNIILDDHYIILGPVVAEFVNMYHLRKIIEGKTHFRITQLIKANRKTKNILYFFSANGVNWSSKMIMGYYYDYGQNRWRQGHLPFPDVLYDRAGHFSKKRKKAARKIRRNFRKNPEIKLFNFQSYFNKSSLYAKLKRHNEMRPHLPDTVLYHSLEDLKMMFSKYDSIYIKSVNGSNGRSVMRVNKDKKGYLYSYYRKKIVEGFCKDLKSLESEMKNFLKKKKIILQKTIDVYQLNGSNVDLRALLQRDAHGKWQIVGMPVRVARKNCVVTSTSTGSTVYQANESFRTIFKFNEEEARRIMKMIIKILKSTVNCIEEEYGRFAEIGIDLAIDKQNRIWLIEANAKPGKDTIYLSSDDKTIERSYYYPLAYCKYLSGFDFNSVQTKVVPIHSVKSDIELSDNIFKQKIKYSDLECYLFKTGGRRELFSEG